MKHTLKVLKMYQGKNNAWALEKMAEQMGSIKTWGDLKIFISNLNDAEVREFMFFPINFIEEKSNIFSSLNKRKEKRKAVKTFYRQFTKKTGAIRWPISENTMLTRRHFGAILTICVLPGYGGRRWDDYIFNAILHGKSEPAHVIALVKYHALYLSRPEEGVKK